MSRNSPVNFVGNGQGKVVVGQGKVREFQTQKILATLFSIKKYLKMTLNDLK